MQVLKTAMSDTPAQFARDLRIRLRQSETEKFPAWSDAEFHRWAVRLFLLQCAANEPYGAWCLAHGAGGRGMNDWRSLPAVPTEAFKLLELSSLPAAERTTYFQSSGTTGHQPSRHFHSPASLELYSASLRPWFRAHLLPEPIRDSGRPDFLNLTPPPGACPHSSLVHMFGDVTGGFGSPDSEFAGRVAHDGTWELDFDRVLRTLQRSQDLNRPLVVLGTAFSFVHLTDHLAAQGLRFQLAPDSRVLETGGYKGRSRTVPKAELHAVIRQFFGIPDAAIVTEYGMSELGSQAYDRIAGSGSGSPDTDKLPRRLRFPPWCRAAVVSPETGDEVDAGGTGLVRVFDLINVWSVAAVQTGDVARDWPDGLELLGRADELEPRGCSRMVA